MDFSQLNELDIEELIVEANFDNNIEFLQEIFLEKKITDINKITEFDKWNYLHRILCYSSPSVDLVNFYISGGLDVNAQDVYGMTPLHYALESKNVEAAIALLEVGANPNLPNIRGITPLCYINGYPERLDLLQLMLDKGGDVDFFTGQHQILEGIKKYRAQDPIFIPVIELMEKYSKQK